MATQVDNMKKALDGFSKVALDTEIDMDNKQHQRMFLTATITLGEQILLTLAAGVDALEALAARHGA